MYVDEIWVQLAENQPQKQVQKRLRGYIHYSASRPIMHRMAVMMENTATTLVSDHPHSSK